MSSKKPAKDAKVFSGQDLAKAVKERLLKFEAQLKDLQARELRKDEHMEPGVHEADVAGEPSHKEPGNHEKFSMDMPQKPPESPVGSSVGLASPSSSDNCPTCGQLDQPGACTCLDQILSAAKSDDVATDSAGAGSMALSKKKEVAVNEKLRKLCKLCKKADCAGKCIAKSVDYIDESGKKVTKGVVGKLPGDEKIKVVGNKTGSGDIEKAGKKSAEKSSEESTEGSKEESSMGKEEMSMDKGAAEDFKEKSAKLGLTTKPAIATTTKEKWKADAAALHAKAEAPPMAKPPSGNIPNATPKSTPKAPVVAAPMSKVLIPAGPGPAAGPAMPPMMKSPGAHGIVDGMKAKSVQLGNHILGKSEDSMGLGNCVDCGNLEHAGKCKR